MHTLVRTFLVHNKVQAGNKNHIGGQVQEDNRIGRVMNGSIM